MTSSIPRKCSSSELHWLLLVYYNNNRAEDGIRTRDFQLGRLMLYQLSYFRFPKKWGEQDSNLRRQSQQIYSLSSLTKLEYLPFSFLFLSSNQTKTKKSRWRDSNPRPRDYKSRALYTN